MESLSFHQETHQPNLIKIPLIRGTPFILLGQRHAKSTAITSTSTTSEQ